MIMRGMYYMYYMDTYLLGTIKNYGGQVNSPATCPRDKCHKITSCLYTCGQV